MTIDREQEKLKSIYSDGLTDRLIEKKELEAREKNRLLLGLTGAAAIALSISLSSIFLVLLESIPEIQSFIVPLLVSLISALASILALFYREKERSKQKLERQKYYLDASEMRLVREWIAFERLSTNFVRDQARQNSPKTLLNTIEMLFEKKLIGEIDKAVLIAALKSRNSIVHLGKSGISNSEEQLLQERLSEINRNLFNQSRDLDSLDG